MKKFVVIVLSLVALVSIQAQASSFYTESGLGQINVEMAGKVYSPYIARAKLGYRISSIYAVEALVGTHAYGDTVDNEEMQIPSLSGLFLRYGTHDDRKLRLYAIAGYAMVDALRDTSSGKFVKEFHGFAYGIGAEERLVSLPALSFTLEYTRYYSENDKELLVYGINAGIRARFQWF